MYNFNFNPLCYRVHLNIMSSDANKLIGEMLDIGNVLFVQSDPVVFLYNGKTKNDLTDAIKRADITEYFCEQILPENCVDQTDMLSVWFKERYERALECAVNAQCQSQLTKINENIYAISSKNNKEGG